VLDALAILLSWVVARVRRAGGSGRAISEMDIHNRANFAVLRVDADNATQFYWQLAKGKAGHARPPVISFLDQLSEYAKTLQQEPYPESALSDLVLPVFVYYPVSRAVLDIPLRIHASPREGILKAWDGALTGTTTNFKQFFEWFRDSNSRRS
jgi:predicted ATP-binding protein involved in virulence